MLPLRSAMALVEPPFSPRGVEREEKDCTHYLCLFIYSVNSFCAGALKRCRTFVRRDPSTLSAVFPYDLNSLGREVHCFALYHREDGAAQSNAEPQ